MEGLTFIIVEISGGYCRPVVLLHESIFRNRLKGGLHGMLLVRMSPRHRPVKSQVGLGGGSLH